MSIQKQSPIIHGRRGVWTPWAATMCVAHFFEDADLNDSAPKSLLTLSHDDVYDGLLTSQLKEGDSFCKCSHPGCDETIYLSDDVAMLKSLVDEFNDIFVDFAGQREGCLAAMNQTGGMCSAATFYFGNEKNQEGVDISRRIMVTYEGEKDGYWLGLYVGDDNDEADYDNEGMMIGRGVRKFTALQILIAFKYESDDNFVKAPADRYNA